MALQRIQFSANADGSSAYTAAANPVDIVMPRDDFDTKTAHPVLDGPNIYIGRAVDNRQYQLIWKGLNQDDYSTMVANFASYKFDDYSQNYMYFHAGTIGTYLGKFSTWTKIKVLKVDIQYRPGSYWILDPLTVVFEVAV